MAQAAVLFLISVFLSAIVLGVFFAYNVRRGKFSDLDPDSWFVRLLAGSGPKRHAISEGARSFENMQDAEMVSHMRDSGIADSVAGSSAADVLRLSLLSWDQFLSPGSRPAIEYWWSAHASAGIEPEGCAQRVASQADVMELARAMAKGFQAMNRRFDEAEGKRQRAFDFPAILDAQETDSGSAKPN